MNLESIEDVPVDRFICDNNLRDGLNEELVQQICDSMSVVGQLQPVIGRRAADRPGFLVMDDGYHRHAAAMRAGLKTLATLVVDCQLDQSEVLLRQLISNCQRENLSDIEAARAAEQLMQFAGVNASQAAAHLKSSGATVSRHRKLLKLPPPILALVESGKIGSSAAYELSLVEDPAKQAELAQALIEKRLTRDGVAGVRKREQRGDRARGRPGRVTAVLGNGRSVSVVGVGLTMETFIGQVEELLAKARRMRTQGVELSTFIKMLRDQAGSEQQGVTT